MLQHPSVVVVAGPNGAGKSTAAPALLRGALSVGDFVNADDIAREHSSSSSAGLAVTAGREMLFRLRTLAQGRVSFAFESTLASRLLADWLAQLIEAGYSVHLLFLWLPSPEAAMERVARRVGEGGHDVPEATVRRRYVRGLRNFLELYQPLATTWRIYDSSDMTDNSPERVGALIAEGRGRAVTLVNDQPTWSQIQRGVYGGR